MKIANNRKQVRFKELNQGDVFHTTISSTLFMKTEPHNGVNTVSVQDGQLNYCGPDATVYVVDCELVIN